MNSTKGAGRGNTGMCEFCTKHGDGKIWYKNAANYAHDLLSDLKRRTYIRDFLSSAFSEGFSTLGRLEVIFRKKGRIPHAVKAAMVQKAKEEHFGQVLPIEEITELVRHANTVVRMPCACRWKTDKQEVRCCYAISYGPEAWYKDIDMSYFGTAPDEGLESVSPHIAIRQIEKLDEQGMVHTIWTMMTPFIGAICNCSLNECLAMKTLSRIEVETMARAEHVAKVDETLCIGCGLCDVQCLFRAVSSITAHGTAIARIDPQKCFGCGLCRRVCSTEAISLVLR